MLLHSTWAALGAHSQGPCLHHSEQGGGRTGWAALTETMGLSPQSLCTPPPPRSHEGDQTLLIRVPQVYPIISTRKPCRDLSPTVAWLAEEGDLEAGGAGQAWLVGG